jgi:hypothetical protein
MIKTFIKTGDIKAEFDFCNNLYSIAHAKVSESSFEVEFREIALANKVWITPLFG